VSWVSNSRKCLYPLVKKLTAPLKAVEKVGNNPVISTKNYKAALDKYVKLVDGGKIPGIKTPRKDAIYKYSKQTSKKIPQYINGTQYKSLVEDIKFYANLAKKTEGFDVKVLTGFGVCAVTISAFFAKSSGEALKIF